jgi:hypothetical protein
LTGLAKRDAEAIRKQLLPGGTMVLMRDGKPTQMTFEVFVRGSSLSGGYHKRRSGDQRRLTRSDTPRLFRLSAGCGIGADEQAGCHHPPGAAGFTDSGGGVGFSAGRCDHGDEVCGVRLFRPGLIGKSQLSQFHE